MTTQIDFFADAELSDISKMRVYESLQKQNDFFDSLDKITVTGAFKGFDEPILIYEDVASAIGHAYGRFRIGTKYYYFYVVDVRQDTPGKTWMRYRLDHWETARMQFGVTLGRGYISRSSLVEPCATPYDPKFHTLVKRAWISRHDPDATRVMPDVVFFAHKSDTNDSRIGYIGGPFTDEELSLLLNGKWMEFLNPLEDGKPHWTAADITGAWFTPPLIDISDWGVADGWKKLDGRDGRFADNTMISIFTADTHDVIDFKNLSYVLSTTVHHQFKTDETHTSVIKDLEGNVVYQFEFGRIFEHDIILELSVSPTSAKWIAYDKRFGYNGPNIFTFPCSAMDVFIDSYIEYFARERDFDISTRGLNAKKDLTSAFVGVGSSAVSGALTGALVGAAGGPIGAAGGAVLGGLGTIIGAGLDYGTNAYFNPKEQEIKDRYYKNSVDPLAIVGSNLLYFLFTGTHECGLFMYEVDADTKARIVSDIEEFGQYTTRAVSSGEPYIALPEHVDEARLRGDFVVNGSIPEAWKAAIQQRFSTGVHIMKRGD